MALTSDIQIKRQAGVIRQYPVAAATKIYKGSLVCLSSGYAVPAADTAGYVFAGIATEHVDNTSGAAGDAHVTVYAKGDFELMAASITQAMVGSTMYVKDDGTVDDTSGTTNDIAVGTLVRYISATRGVVAI